MVRCEIADLLIEIPVAGGLAPRCSEYLYDGDRCADIIIHKELYKPERYPFSLNEESLAYMESAFQFYSELVKHNGLFLHASAVAYNGKAYMFSGKCGEGKSTHTQLWQKVFGEEAQVFNDDKPALRYVDDCWYAYGTPWCGKDGINQNRKIALAGVCFLKQAPYNRIRRLSQQEAMQKILSQTIRKFEKVELLDLMLASVDKLVRQIPVFEMENRPEPDAVRLSYETMRRTSEEIGL